MLAYTLVRYYAADIRFAESSKQMNINPGQAYNELIATVNLRGKEPEYHSELGYAAAVAAVGLAEEDGTVSGELKKEAMEETDKALRQSPKNVSYYRNKIRAYFFLSSIDKSFTQKTLEAIDQAITLAPTDVKLIYNKALILEQTGKIAEAISELEKAVSLKPNYREARYLLGIFYWDKKEPEKAKEQLQAILKITPDDPEALEKLKEWGK